MSESDRLIDCFGNVHSKIPMSGTDFCGINA